VAGEAKQQETPGLSPLSAWDGLVWKLDALDKRFDAMAQGIDKRLDAMDQGLNRRLDRVEARIDRLEEELRSTRQSFVIRQFTAVLGFTVMLVSIWLFRQLPP